MAVFKCKMCGGTIEFTEGATVGVCDSCGTKQTLPKTQDDYITNLFARANSLRMKCEFDKAEEIYNKILEQDNTEAEAHWGIILCKYGIEYVDDPATAKKIPTCHRTSYEAVITDAEYKAAIEFADDEQKTVYAAEAKAIDEIQHNILEVVKNEKPFDVFICYKETDENGKRTQDSVIANDIYYQLTQEGFKVFYAAITLEDKLGQEYEPYIFAALNSAKVMLAVGTKPEYFNAVWVKNEWSRFIKIMKADRSKLLIPCYRDMDAYDLPEEFAHLQAQDMSKIGFINDVVRGIKKIIPANESAEPRTAAQTRQPKTPPKATPPAANNRSNGTAVKSTAQGDEGDTAEPKNDTRKSLGKFALILSIMALLFVVFAICYSAYNFSFISISACFGYGTFMCFPLIAIFSIILAIAAKKSKTGFAAILLDVVVILLSLYFR